jgi:hypothetical protein
MANFDIPALVTFVRTQTSRPKVPPPTRRSNCCRSR